MQAQSVCCVSAFTTLSLSNYSIKQQAGKNQEQRSESEKGSKSMRTENPGTETKSRVQSRGRFMKPGENNAHEETDDRRRLKMMWRDSKMIPENRCRGWQNR